MGGTSPSAPLAQPPPLSRGGFGISAKFPLNEQSLFVSWVVVLRCPGQRQLDKVRCPEAAALCSKARPFAPYRTSGVQVGSGPVCQGLSLWERWHAAGVTERASQLRQSRHTAMSRLFCQSDTIAVLSLLRQRPCPLRRFAPALPKGEPFRTPHRTARSR